MARALADLDALVVGIDIRQYLKAAEGAKDKCTSAAVDFEALAKLKPDLILVWGSGTSERVKSKLRSLGLPVYEIEIRNVAGLADTLRSIGRLAGTEGVAQARS